jgi:small-conductance mechanosensitive channel
VEQPFRVGDQIEVTNQKGVVEKVDIRTTVLRNDLDELVLVPNFIIFSQVVLNRQTHVDLPDRFAIEGLSAPPSDVQKILLQVSKGLPLRQEPKIEITKAELEKYDYEVSVWWNDGAADQFALVACLREHFPEATITKVTAQT